MNSKTFHKSSPNLSLDDAWPDTSDSFGLSQYKSTKNVVTQPNRVGLDGSIRALINGNELQQFPKGSATTTTTTNSSTTKSATTAENNNMSLEHILLQQLSAQILRLEDAQKKSQETIDRLESAQRETKVEMTRLKEANFSAQNEIKSLKKILRRASGKKAENVDTGRSNFVRAKKTNANRSRSFDVLPTHSRARNAQNLAFLDSIQPQQKTYFSSRYVKHNPNDQSKVPVQFLNKLPAKTQSKKQLFLKVRLPDASRPDVPDFTECHYKCSVGFIQNNLDDFARLLFNGEGRSKYPGGVVVMIWGINRRESFCIAENFVDDTIQNLKTTEFPSRVVTGFFIEFSNSSFSKQKVPKFWAENLHKIEFQPNEKDNNRPIPEITSVVTNVNDESRKFKIKIVGNAENLKISSFKFKQLY